ncbi:MAG: amidase domain-containing protein, partial [Anaerolineales bacterium]|nr:amidase domain-containing protein [Anaerolineales bacterium]
EARYSSISTLQLGNFNGLIDESLDGNTFLRSELDKLDIEIAHAKLHGLKYSQYKYFLDFREISIDTLSQTANVSVVEGHDVVFEITDPVVSSMRNLHHSIALRKDNGAWKIVSDAYVDYLWNIIKTTGLSKQELIQIITESKSLITSDNEPQDAVIDPQLYSQPNTGTYPYNRDGAVAYAHQWAFGRNPKYFDFGLPGYGGDCTNFVSQAMYEGGSAIMAFPPDYQPGIHNSGWFYNSQDDWADAWIWVDSLYSFILNLDPGVTWLAGPDGIEAPNQYQVDKGDLIQYEMQGNSIWDHSVIIVDFDEPAPGILIPLVASHGMTGQNQDHDNYPFTYFSYASIRFIHINWNRGYRTFLPIILNNESGMASQMQTPLMGPYPEPMDAGGLTVPLPYPPPAIFPDSYLEPYPAP